ncbi:glutathione S-transferase family protein [Mesorhizobium microcysteis]|uniref:Glutathione S-transferase family protein n=1 Tax=Neoaquamicrobium microcysteis TaxID=2682781 RepID=A0A5D4GVD3_9HYPH|nr:glutathione S-transferase family protein [Mesorhizobium microcysteis]TYR32831.1 glutathione S-transferase family protein [Mesorhizobium microcysteis]
MTILLYDLVGSDPARPFSPHCWKAAFALAHKGLAFESVPTPFTAVKGVEGGVFGTVPVIRDGERVVGDSFAIALYLEETYPDRPSLFAGEGGKAASRFIERWSQLTVHPFLGAAALMDIHDRLAPEDQAHFRTTREARFGRPIEDVPADRDSHLQGFRAKLEPLRSMLTYQPFIGGDRPLFADYIVAGAFQWLRVISPYKVLADDDPVGVWFERCLDLHGGLGRRVSAAA